MRALVRLGDQTTFGFVITATTTWSEDRRAIARTGDLATCSKCKGAFPLLGTAFDWTEEHRAFVATGDRVNCGCPNHVAYGSTTQYSRTEPVVTPAPAPVRAAAPASAASPNVRAPAASPAVQPQQNASFSNSTMAAVKARTPVPELVEFYDPGFYIVPKSNTVEKLKAELFTSPTTAVLDKFRALNPELGPQVKAGQMIVLSDPTNTQCTEVEALLMTAAQRVNDILQNMTPEEADFMTRHGKEIESFLSHGSTSVGVAETALGKHMESIKVLMQDIDRLHSDTLAKHGHLKSEEFFARRRQLLSSLDKQLNGLTKKSIGFPDHPKLKTALGISSRSLVHQFRLTGTYQQSAGYLTHLEGVAKAAKYIKGGGYVGIAVGGAASAVKVQNVCAKGDDQACEKIKYTESGAFIGGLTGGFFVGNAISASAVPICIALGVPTGGVGTAVCAVGVVGTVSLASGKFFEKAGELAGELIYKAAQ
ncbi:PAAR domain-containing protein [Pseudomonas sp. NPDC090202]|uniref:PAAR domain-containing protein n=1 Tax=unclassified Pseudomonas TaxID=196821 RepID=UPI00380E5E61